MGKSETRHILRNLMTAPASDDALVEALLAFASGDEVVICGQPARGEVASWSRWRSVPGAEERDAHRELLQQLIQDPWGPLPSVVDGAGRRRPAAAVIRFPALQEAPEHSLSPDRDFFAYLAHMHDSMERELILVARPKGYAVADFRSFENVASALAFATLLVMDQSRPYGKALSRCKLPKCQRFYLARKSAKGGPPNRTYCDPEHRKEHNNSAARKKEPRVVRSGGRKHK